MFDLFLPFLIGTALGIEPVPEEPRSAPAAVEVTAVEPLSLGSGDDLGADREPEPQIATGKFTTALEVRPILGATKGNWVAVREFNGQDLIYFTHLLSWRCGLWDIRYGVNGASAETVVPMEPCNEQFAQPNVMVDVENYSPYVALPLGSVEAISVEIVFDDGTRKTAQFNRNDILIP